MASLRPFTLAEFRVQLDSGSSDLWIFSPKADLKLTGKSKFVVKETYGIGEADGPVVFGELKLGAYTVPNQGNVLYYLLRMCFT